MRRNIETAIVNRHLCTHTYALGSDPLTRLSLDWHLHRRGGDLTYFHDAGSGAECDFLRESDDGSFEAVQVTWVLSDENEERETMGLLKAMRRFGLKEGTIVTRDQTDLITEGGFTIRVVPAHEFLTQGSALT